MHVRPLASSRMLSTLASRELVSSQGRVRVQWPQRGGRSVHNVYPPARRPNSQSEEEAFERTLTLWTHHPSAATLPLLTCIGYRHWQWARAADGDMHKFIEGPNNDIVMQWQQLPQPRPRAWCPRRS